MRVNLARFVFNQSVSMFFCVVSLRLRIISLMLSFNDATSPCAPTVMERVKSPLVTAVDTSALARYGCDLIGKSGEGVGHVIDCVGELRDFAFGFHCEL